MESAYKRLLQNAVLVLLSTGVILVSLELCFRYIVIQSNGIEVTLSSQKWLKTYWKPINSFGFRDYEHPDDSIRGKKTVFVIGDSFVAGVGIKNIDQRFSNIIGRNLGNAYIVFNIADRGWNTDTELEALMYAPFKPDTVILSYYINDIAGAARNLNTESPEVQEYYDINRNNSLFHVIRKSSFFIDFVFWRLYPLTMENHSGWLQWIRNVYANQAIWDAHRLELKTFIGHCRANNIKLLVVIFPNLADVPGSTVITSKVSKVFTDEGIHTLDLSEHFAQENKSRLMVNSTDAHPSLYVHAYVAERLSPLIPAR